MDFDAPEIVIFLQRLKDIYEDMDMKYSEAADRYGFYCTGCEDNCCRTRFHHHTHMEYAYLMKGFYTLNAEIQDDIHQLSATICRDSSIVNLKSKIVNSMCPLNFDGQCILYKYRPMICRLHGLPHEIQKPGVPISYFPGCNAFVKRCGEKPYIKFDRTPFYIQMAQLEADIKAALGVTGKIKMTIAEMIFDGAYRT